MADANIRAVITAKDDASRVVQGFGSNVGNIAKGVAIGTLAVQGITLALQKFKEAASFALKSTAEFEQSRIAFEVMLGSAQKAKRLLADINDFAVRTPFELPELVEGAKRLLAYNIEAEKLLPTLNALGSIAAGVGTEKLPQIILAFGQVKAATRLTGMELRQFTEAGVPLLDILAKQSGKTAAQIKEAMEDGAAPSFEEVEKAVFSMSKEGGKFFNLLDRQAKTFNGTVSNIRDQFGRVAREIMGITAEGEIRKGSIFFYLKEGATAFLGWLDANKQSILNTFQQIFNFLGPKLQELMPQIQKFVAETLAPMAHTFGVVLVQAIGLFLDVLNGLLPWLNNNKGVVQGLIATWLIFRSVMLLQGVLGAFTAVMVGVRAQALLTAGAGGIGAVSKSARTMQLLLASPLVVKVSVAAAMVVLGIMYNRLLEIAGLLQSLDAKRDAAISRARDKVINAKTKKERQDAQRELYMAGNVPKFGRQMGGPVMAGGRYMVGEAGPEEFVPAVPGHIVPHDKAGGGAPVVININTNVGVFAGTLIERRKLAETILSDIKDVAQSRNMNLNQMLGAK